ncbi:Hypothetical protein BRZCDTV_451, partial [Brazilian cedratvirus IHUMI]
VERERESNVWYQSCLQVRASSDLWWRERESSGERLVPSSFVTLGYRSTVLSLSLSLLLL